MELSTRVGLDVETVKREVQRLREGQYVRVVDEKVEIPEIETLERLYALLGLKDELQGHDPAAAGTPSPGGPIPHAGGGGGSARGAPPAGNPVVPGPHIAADGTRDR